jgi:hypothetical protein
VRKESRKTANNDQKPVLMGVNNQRVNARLLDSTYAGFVRFPALILREWEVEGRLATA